MKNKKITLILLIFLVIFIFVFLLMNEKEIPKVKIVPPQFVFNTLNNEDEKILLVNVLSDKMKYKITLNGDNDNRSLSKKEFEDLLKENNNKVPEDIKSVIIYCASWSCNGAKNYYKELIDKNVNVDKIVDYIGAIHEWASYSLINSDIFTFNSTENNERLSSEEVLDIFKNTAHTYYIDNVMEDKFLKNKSLDGKNMINNFSN